MQCVHVEESTNKRCTHVVHPLCAEISDRLRVVTPTPGGDAIYYHCGFHSFGIGTDKCGICNLSDKQSDMLECDGCQKGHHMQCLTPPLTAIPDDDWFCPKCTSKE